MLLTKMIHTNYWPIDFLKLLRGGKTVKESTKQWLQGAQGWCCCCLSVGFSNFLAKIRGFSTFLVKIRGFSTFLAKITLLSQARWLCSLWAGCLWFFAVWTDHICPRFGSCSAPRRAWLVLSSHQGVNHSTGQGQSSSHMEAVAAC